MATVSCSAIAALSPTPSRKGFTPHTSLSFSYCVNGRTLPSVSSRRVDFCQTRRRRRMSCKCLFGLGVPELVVIAGVAALVFGPKQLPEVGRSLGKTIKSFQKAAKEFETELKKDAGPSSDEPPADKGMTADEEQNKDTKVTTMSDGS